MKYYIPSLKTYIEFKPFTIKQLKNIFLLNSKHPFLNIGYNIGIINTIEYNNINNIQLTDFDKHIIALQFKYIDFNQNTFSGEHIIHPPQYIIQQNSYYVKCQVPDLLKEKEHCSTLLTLQTKNADTLLLAEITKYIQYLEINNTNIQLNNTLKEQIKSVKQLPVSILADIVKYIDKIKRNIATAYNPYRYDITLFV